MDPKVERGQVAIVEHVKEVMQTYLIEATEFVFQWREEFERARWILIVHRGKVRRQVSFREDDMEAWPGDPQVAGKYREAILDLVDWFLKRE